MVGQTLAWIGCFMLLIFLFSFELLTFLLFTSVRAKLQRRAFEVSIV